MKKKIRMKRRDCKLANLDAEIQDVVERMGRELGLSAAAAALRTPISRGGFDIQVSVATLSRFMRERAEQRLRESRGKVCEAMGELAGLDRKQFRGGTLAMLQQRMYEEAVTTENPQMVKETYELLAAQEQRERELEVAERHAAVAEENAKAARRKVELAAANSALALLPKLQEILLREGMPDAEIVQEARRCLLAGGGELMGIAEKSVLTGIEERKYPDVRFD